MATNILQPPIEQVTPQPSVTSLQEVAETVQSDALQHAHTRFILPIQAAGLAELLQRHDFVEHFKFGLAERIAGTLAAYDEHVQAIYYFDPNLNPDAETETYAALDASVNLLVQVESKSAALESFIIAVDRALTEQVRKLPSPLFASLASVLNTILITQDDVEQKRGHAVLLSSFYLKPRQVWRRR